MIQKLLEEQICKGEFLLNVKFEFPAKTLESIPVLLDGQVTKYLVNFRNVWSNSRVRCSLDDLLSKWDITKKPRPMFEKKIKSIEEFLKFQFNGNFFYGFFPKEK